MNIHYGDWNIVRKIGSGSFGIVYEIERESFGFHQKAALKVISIPQSQNDVASIRNTGMDEASIGDYYRDLATEIVKELQTMEQLKGHTNIVSYEDHEIRPKAEGVGWEIYIRMELLTPLQKYLSGHQMNRDEVIHLGIDLCRALERCESLNIIHRDIKPDNIFLSNQGDGKLGDFGIARSAERTMSGMSRKGTFGYMAPEVYKGQPYGKTVDIYSLGLVLYRLLNYNRGPFLPPYPDPIKYQDQSQALARRIQGETLSAPAQADPKLAEVVLKACSYDPKKRFSTAEEMRLALQALVGLEIEPIVPCVDMNAEIRQTAQAEKDSTVYGVPSDNVNQPHIEPQQDHWKSIRQGMETKAEISGGETVRGFGSHQESNKYVSGKVIQNDETVSVFHVHNQASSVWETDRNNIELVHERRLADDKTVSLFKKNKSPNRTEASGGQEDGKKEADFPKEVSMSKESRKDSVSRSEKPDEKGMDDDTVGLKKWNGILRASIGAIIGGLIHYYIWTKLLLPFLYDTIFDPLELYYGSVIVIPLLSWLGCLSVRKITGIADILKAFTPAVVSILVCVWWIYGLDYMLFLCYSLKYVLLIVVMAVLIMLITRNKNKG